jgi:hypothetical protein
MKKRGYRYSGIGVKLTINDAGLRNADLGAIGAYFEIPRLGNKVVENPDHIVYTRQKMVEIALNAVSRSQISGISDWEMMRIFGDWFRIDALQNATGSRVFMRNLPWTIVRAYTMSI